MQPAATVLTPLPGLLPAAKAPDLSFLSNTPWRHADRESITGDASGRKYYRLRNGGDSAILMDASRNPESVPPFVRIDAHLRRLGLSAPEILAGDEEKALLLLEDFGDATFARVLDCGGDPEPAFALATDLLAALHQKPGAIPDRLRAYDPEAMLADVEWFVDWCATGVDDAARAEFRSAWLEVLPLAHRVPASLLLRDYHAGNLMLLPRRAGILRAGLLDFQDAYQGPVTYDLVSLLEDARRDVPEKLRRAMLERYLARFPGTDRRAFATSAAILAALRHARVLAVFERLKQREGRPEYRRLYSARVQGLLDRALQHPALDRLKRWIRRHAANH